ncbi:MAG: hypothetical protein OXH70_08375 [Acidobacteria bacterium]|nr:hypothetical protein [Acidobacteriota bacterium]
MTLTVHVLGLLSVLGAAVFGAAGVPRGAVPRRRIWFFPAAGFLVTWPVASGTGGAYPMAVGVTATAIALAALLGRPPLYVASFASGAAAALWSRYLEVLGLPVWITVPVAATMPAVAVWLSAVRPVFAPPRLREEGLLLVVALGLAVAFLPELVVGWQSASALNTGSLRDPSTVAQPAAWALVAAAAAAVAGGFVAARRRRAPAVAGRRRR